MKVCMLAYAHYLNDARIKCYVRTLEDNGHSVDVITLRSDGEHVSEKLRKGTIYRLMAKYQGQSTILYACSYALFFFKAFCCLLRNYVAKRYDVIHVHNMPNALVLAAILPKMFGARIILDVHDLMTVNYMAKFRVRKTDIPVQILKLEQKISSIVANHVICADHNQKDYLIDECKIPSGKITVLLNLPNEEIFRPVTKVRSSSDKVFKIVYHGTIAHRLGIDLILQAMAIVVSRIPAEMWIYGTGDYIEDALKLSSELSLNEKVHFSQAFFPVEKIPQFVCGMDLGLIGNRRNLACDRYMLPVKLLEYAYLRVPVVAPRLGIITRYFNDQMLRFYEPENVEQMANAIVELFYDENGRAKQAENAYSFYKNFNIKEQADSYLDLLTN
jgi:glycosyltransferase involved in cell wall biosynthesis